MVFCIAGLGRSLRGTRKLFRFDRLRNESWIVDHGSLWDRNETGPGSVSDRFWIDYVYISNESWDDPGPTLCRSWIAPGLISDRSRIGPGST